MHWQRDFAGLGREVEKIYCVPVCPTVSERAEGDGDFTQECQVAKWPGHRGALVDRDEKRCNAGNGKARAAAQHRPIGGTI